jgi:hypothetical protein
LSHLADRIIRAEEKMELTTPFGSTVTSYYSCFVSFLVFYNSIAPRSRAVISGLKAVYLQRRGEESGVEGVR